MENEYNFDEPNFNLIKATLSIKASVEDEELKTLSKKRERSKDETDIIFDKHNNKIINSFIPDLEELNNFLKKCTIKEIQLEDIKEEIGKFPNDKIFDPDEFIKKNYENYSNKNFSIEDLGLKLEKLDIKREKEKDVELIDKNNDKKFLNEILKEKDLSKQKKEINELINKIKKMKIEETINTNKKLNIVFDLDNTCIFSFPYNLKEINNLEQKNQGNDVKNIKFECNGNKFYASLTIRKKLKEFFEYTKNFCNFYIKGKNK